MTSAIGLRDQRVRTYAKSDQGTDGVVRPVFTFASEYWGRIDESAAAVRFAQEKLQLRVDALAEFSDDVAIPVNGFLLDTLTGLHWWVRKIYNVRALHRLWVGLDLISEEQVATFERYEGASTLDGVHVIDPGTPPEGASTLSAAIAAMQPAQLSASGGLTYSIADALADAQALAAAGLGCYWKYSAGDPIANLGGTFARASAATYVDVNGVVQTASSGVLRDGHYIGAVRTTLLETISATNLCLQNRDLSNAAFAKTNGSGAKNATGVDGVANSASTFTEDTTATNNHFFSQQFSKAASALAYGVAYDLKPNGRTRCRIRMDDGAGNGGQWEVDLTAGTVSGMTQIGGSPATALFTRYVAGVNGWARISVSATSNTVTTFRAILYLEDASGNVVYTGDGVSGMLVDFVQFEQSSVWTSRIATAGASVTRATENLSFTIPSCANIPLSMALYFDAYDQGTCKVVGGYMDVGTHSGAGPSVGIYAVTANGTDIFYQDGSIQYEQSVSPNPTFGDELEVVGQLVPATSLAIIVSKNGGATLTGTRGALGALHPAAWFLAQVNAGRYGPNGGGGGYAAFRSLKVFANPTVTMAQARAA